MKFLSLFSAAILALVFLPSCGSGPGHVDARNPTISQMDNLDVQWGLPRRTTRGTPKRLYPTLPGESTPASDGAVAPTLPPAQPAAAASPAPAAQPQAPVTVDPSVINKLR